MVLCLHARTSSATTYVLQPLFSESFFFLLADYAAAHCQPLHPARSSHVSRPIMYSSSRGTLVRRDGRPIPLPIYLSSLFALAVSTQTPQGHELLKGMSQADPPRAALRKQMSRKGSGALKDADAACSPERSDSLNNDGMPELGR